MTLLLTRSSLSAGPASSADRKLGHRTARPTLTDIEVVVPVRDNAEGVRRIAAWWSSRGAGCRPQALHVVDDGSREAVRVAASGVVVHRIPQRGPAAARNVGWRAARSPWIAFIDSDCLPGPRWPAAFSESWRGEVALQGAVRAVERGSISRFYDSQRILTPMRWVDGRPEYVISANVLVSRDALEAIGGFAERFRIAAGEDVDLGHRLAQVGLLGWCEAASVFHDFDESLASFAARFFRYGRGNWMLAKDEPSRLRDEVRPRPFRPCVRSPVNVALARVAYAAMLAGWSTDAACDYLAARLACRCSRCADRCHPPRQCRQNSHHREPGEP